MKVLCLTGWQQPADALSVIAPEDTIHFKYDVYVDVNTAINTMPLTPDTAIGWSLGGQLLVRAVASGHVRPKKIILLGAAFQFLNSDNYQNGIPTADFTNVVQGYKNKPEDMLRGFHVMVGSGDSQSVRITRTLNTSLVLWKNGLFWLEELGRFSCTSLNFSNFPETIIVHGKNDKVTSPKQAEDFKHLIPHAQLRLLDDCAHAPHLHDSQSLKQLIFSHV